MAGDRDEVERIVAVGVGRADSADARRAHLAKRLADTRFFRDRDLAGALAAHEAARERLTDPDAIAAVDARRATLLAGAGRPAEALARHRRDGPGRRRRARGSSWRARPRPA